MEIAADEPKSESKQGESKEEKEVFDADDNEKDIGQLHEIVIVETTEYK